MAPGGHRAGTGVSASVPAQARAGLNDAMHDLGKAHVPRGPGVHRYRQARPQAPGCGRRCARLRRSVRPAVPHQQRPETDETAKSMPRRQRSAPPRCHTFSRPAASITSRPPQPASAPGSCSRRASAGRFGRAARCIAHCNCDDACVAVVSRQMRGNGLGDRPPADHAKVQRSARHWLSQRRTGG